MKILETRTVLEAVRLTQPYSIAGRTIDAVDLFYLEILTEEGLCGLGSASPSAAVTGESPQACAEALSEQGLSFLVGQDARCFGSLQRQAAERLEQTPAALAAVDMALWDLAGKVLGQPVADLLGPRQPPRLTSITLGIRDLEETLEEAKGYLERGFRCLKVKIGEDLEADLERLRHLRRLAGPEVAIRVDGNQGYSAGDARRLGAVVEGLELELVEQPLARGREADLAAWPLALRRRVAADESLHDARDALGLVRGDACGIFNIKLMKCGGISGALRIAAVAEAAGVELMWGCMDESVLSISAALHTAYATERTRYLDLDGSFDLASDPAHGGFEVRAGALHLTGGPGLGVRLER